jgi:hypothetical protein
MKAKIRPNTKVTTTSKIEAMTITPMGSWFLTSIVVIVSIDAMLVKRGSKERWKMEDK